MGQVEPDFPPVVVALRAFPGRLIQRRLALDYKGLDALEEGPKLFLVRVTYS